MSDGEYIVSVSNLCKKFNAVIALQSLSLNVEPGIFGLIGPNGAGKTTLLRILLGLVKPSSGSAFVLGYNIHHDSVKIRRKIGVLHEKPFFPTSITVQRYLQFVNSFYGTTTSVNELLSIVGLSDAADRKIGHLSAGMYQRLGLAQALCGEPKLVFLDEPTSHLDVGGRDDVVRLIVRVHKETDTSFFISSHILSELERACDSVAFVNSGKVIDSGPVHDLIKRNTKNRFQVTTSDSHALAKTLQELESIVSITVTGSTALTVEVSSSFNDSPGLLIKEVAANKGIEVYRIDSTGTLEDVYRKVIISEE
ncbi:MAG: ABC transporter ATP-binding protein [Candidatus Thorarchaeota archaeon]|nr:ABC transporter ATP-binding protein [Candidatus Thorarchaeota archaeon]